MEVFEAIKKRYSCRSYLEDPVLESKLNKILEAARLAPSARNSQDWKFVVVKDKEKKEKIAKASGQSFLSRAPLIIAGVSLNPEYIMSCQVPAHAVDLAIALEHIALQAAEEGLATCWIGGFPQDEIKQILNIPENCKAVALMSLGFPADQPGEKSRKGLQEIVCQDSF